MLNELQICKKCGGEYWEVWCLVMDQYIHYHNTKCDCKKPTIDPKFINDALEKTDSFIKRMLVEKLLKK